MNPTLLNARSVHGQFIGTTKIYTVFMTILSRGKSTSMCDECGTKELSMRYWIAGEIRSSHNTDGVHESVLRCFACTCKKVVL